MEKLRHFLTFKSAHLITTLTYVLMDNFYPCLLIDEVRINLMSYIVYILFNFLTIVESVLKGLSTNLKFLKIPSYESNLL